MGIDQKIVFKGVKILEASYYIQMKMSYNKVKKKKHMMFSLGWKHKCGSHQHAFGIAGGEMDEVTQEVIKTEMGSKN